MENKFNVIDLGQIYRNADAGRASAQNAQTQQMQIEQAMDQRRKQNAMNEIFARNYQQEQQIPAEQISGPTQIGEPLIGRPAQTIPGKMNMSGAMQEMYGSGLAPEAWKMQMEQDAITQRSFGSKPSAIQVFEYFKNLPNNNDRETMLRTMRGAQYGDVGGVRSEMPALPGGQARQLISLENEAAGQGAIAGRKSDATARATAGVTAETEASKKTEKAANVADLANEANMLLDKASGSYGGAAVSFGKRAVGYSDETTQANKRLALISGWMVSNVPRMEGPQSNFDVQNYQKMAADVGDVTIPIEDRKAALATLLDLQRKYSSNLRANTINQSDRRFNEQSVPSVPARSGGQIKKIGNDTYVNVNGQWYKQ